MSRAQAAQHFETVYPGQADIEHDQVDPATARGLERAGPVGGDDLAARVERLEAGVRLMAETVKRACVELADSVDRLREATEARPAEDTEAVLVRGLEPVSQSILQLQDSVQGFPMILAAAADHLKDQMAEQRAWIEDTVAGFAAAGYRSPDGTASEPGTREARAIWGSHARG